MATNRIEAAKQLSAISKMADSSFMGGKINKDQHAKIKERARGLALENIFKAMADYCNK